MLLRIKRAAGEGIQIGKKEEVVVSVLAVHHGVVEIGVQLSRPLPIDWGRPRNKYGHKKHKPNVK